MSTSTNILITNIMQQIEASLNNFVFSGYQAASNYLKIPLGIIAALYVAILGYSIMMCWVRVSMGNFVKAVLKIGFIYMLVTQWGWVSEYIVNFINQATGEIGEALVRVSPMHISEGKGVYGALQEILSGFANLGGRVIAAGNWHMFSPFLDGAVILAVGFILVGFALFQLILAKCLLAILFVFTPLMALACFFKPTHAIFDRWLGSIVGVFLLQLFIITALAFALSLSNWWIEFHKLDSAIQIGNADSWSVILIGIISIGLILKVSHIANNIGMAVNSANASNLIGGVISGGGHMGSKSELSLGLTLGKVLSGTPGESSISGKASVSGNKNKR